MRHPELVEGLYQEEDKEISRTDGGTLLFLKRKDLDIHLFRV